MPEPILDRKRGASSSGRGLLRGLGKAMAVVLSFGVLAVFAGLIWYAYNEVYGTTEPSELPYIAAEAAPIKVKPEDEGGKTVLHQDKLVLDETIAQLEEIPKVEHLLPPPEEPMEIEVESEAVDAEVGDGQAGEVEAPSEEIGDSEAPLEAADSASPSEPTVELEITTRSSAVVQEVTESSVSEVDEAESGDAIAALIETTVESVSDEARESEEVAKAVDNSASTSVQTAQVPTDDGYVVQLSAVTSHEAAENEWKRIQRAHAGLLGDMSLRTETTVKNGITYHRVQTGPFPTKATASDLCGQLKSRGQDCLVKRK